MIRQLLTASPAGKVSTKDLRSVVQSLGLASTHAKTLQLVQEAFPRSYRSPDRQHIVGVSWTTQGRQILEWESRLGAAGLPPELSGTAGASDPDRVLASVGSDADPVGLADAEYFTIAEDHLQTWNFRTATEGQVWRLHTEGRSDREIMRAVHRTKSSVTRTIQRHQLHSGLRRRPHVTRQQAIHYMAIAIFEDATERRIAWLALVERYSAANIRDELRITLHKARTIVARHERRLYAGLPRTKQPGVHAPSKKDQPGPAPPALAGPAGTVCGDAGGDAR